MRLFSIALAFFVSSAYCGRLARLMEEPSEIDMENSGDQAPAEGDSTLFDGIKEGVGPPKNVGFCSTEPCGAQTGTDCCCWSNAAMEEHPSFPNPDEQEAQRKCETPPDMEMADLIMLKDPGYTGSSGRYEALKVVAPVYNDRDLCCAFHISDPIVLSLRRPTVEPLPPTTSWMPEPTLPPPPTSTPDPLLLQDAVAASMEKASGDYMDAAEAIHSTANDLESALASVKSEADINFKKKAFTNKLRGIIQHYVTESNNAVEALNGAVGH